MSVHFPNARISNQTIYNSENAVIAAKLPDMAEKNDIETFARSLGISTSKLIKQALKTRMMYPEPQQHYKLQQYQAEVAEFLKTLPDLTIVDL